MLKQALYIAMALSLVHLPGSLASVVGGSGESGPIGEAQAAALEGDHDRSIRLFEQVLEEDKKEVAAYLGIARAHWSKGEPAPGMDWVKKGLRYARGTERLDLYAVGIRLTSQMDFPEGLKRARSYNNRARNLNGYREHAGVQLAMALVWVRDHEIDKAKTFLQRALATDGQWRTEAEESYQRVQFIERLLAGSPRISDMAYQPSVTRAEIASFMVRELQIVQQLGAPEGQASQGETSSEGLTDYRDHSASGDIVTLHRLGLRSLKIRDGRFSPDKPLSRLNLALLIEDLLFKAQGISRTQFIGNQSPFVDLANSHTGFNAMMTAVSRGLIEGRSNGRIMPAAAVSGAEAVLALTRLQQNL